MNKSNVLREAGRLANLAARSGNADLLAAAHHMVDLAWRMDGSVRRLWLHRKVNRKGSMRKIKNATTVRWTPADTQAIEDLKANRGIEKDSDALRLALNTLPGAEGWISQDEYKCIQAGLSDADLSLRLTGWLLKLAERYTRVESQVVKK